MWRSEANRPLPLEDDDMQSMRRSRSVLVELMIAVLFLAIAACILARLHQCGGNKVQTAASLGIGYATLLRKLKSYRVE